MECPLSDKTVSSVKTRLGPCQRAWDKADSRKYLLNNAGVTVLDSAHTPAPLIHTACGLLSVPFCLLPPVPSAADEPNETVQCESTL